MNNTLKKLTHQEKSYRTNARIIGNKHPEIFHPEKYDEDNLRDIISSLTYSERRVLDIVVALGDTYITSFPSQSTIAKKAGCTKETAHIAIKKLCELKLIDSCWRGFKKTNIYRVSQIFYDPYVRTYLKDLVPSFAKLSILWLLLLCANSIESKKTCQSEYLVLLSSYFDVYIKTNTNKFVFSKRKTSDYVRGDVKFAKNGVSSNTRRRVMELTKENVPNVVPNYVKNIDCTRLTLAGQCSLSIFAKEAIDYAVAEFKRHSSPIRDDFRFLFGLAHSYSQGKKLPINHALGFSLRDAAELRDETVMFVRNSDRKTSYRSHTPKHTSPNYKKIASPRFTIEQIRAANPHIDLTNAYLDGNRVVVNNHFDTEWRAVTQQEKEIWKENIAKAQDSPGAAWLKAQGLTLPDAPEFFQGDGNRKAQTIYHVDSNFQVHPTSSERDQANRALEEQSMRRRQPYHATSKRSVDGYSLKERELIEWFSDYYTWRKPRLDESLNAWYIGLLSDVESQAPDIVKKLGDIRVAVEKEGWRRHETTRSFSKLVIPQNETK